MRERDGAASQPTGNAAALTHSDGQKQAAMDLVACLKAFAAANTNAVLEIIRNKPFVANRHYPDGDLVFGAGRWRAYYHAHEMPGSAGSDSHGHFHIFARPEDPNAGFAHVAALMVDRQGQPLRWFTANHWVTGEVWREGADIAADMPPQAEAGDVDLAAHWLSAMLRLCAPTLADLLSERDTALAAYCSRTGQSDEEARADRGLYVLSEREIDLMSELSAGLALEAGD